MKVINASAPHNVAELAHGNVSLKFSYISVTRPTFSMSAVDVYDKNGNPQQVVGASTVLPVEFEVDSTTYDLVLANTPCDIKFSIGSDRIVMRNCFVRQDSTDGYILRMHTTDVRLY